MYLVHRTGTPGTQDRYTGVPVHSVHACRRTGVQVVHVVQVVQVPPVPGVPGVPPVPGTGTGTGGTEEVHMWTQVCSGSSRVNDVHIRTI